MLRSAVPFSKASTKKAHHYGALLCTLLQQKLLRDGNGGLDIYI